MRLIDLTGQRFGRLTVVEQVTNSVGGRTRWRCLCDCGVERTTTAKSLRRGDAKFCATACVEAQGRRPYPADHRYLAGPDGSVVGPSGILLTPWMDHNGYLVVGIGRRFTFLHVVVCESFHGPRPEGMQVAHKNGIKVDCSASNLSWKTPTENQADKILHGTHLEGELIHNAKLTKDKIREIREAGARGELQEIIGRRYGIHQRTVSRILLRQAWKHVS